MEIWDYQAFQDQKENADQEVAKVLMDPQALKEKWEIEDQLDIQEVKVHQDPKDHQEM